MGQQSSAPSLHSDILKTIVIFLKAKFYAIQLVVAYQWTLSLNPFLFSVPLIDGCYQNSPKKWPLVNYRMSSEIFLCREDRETNETLTSGAFCALANLEQWKLSGFKSWIDYVKPQLNVKMEQVVVYQVVLLPTNFPDNMLKGSSLHGPKWGYWILNLAWISCGFYVYLGE